MYQNLAIRVLLFSLLIILFTGCGTTKSSYSYKSNYLPNTPIKNENCWDAAVLLTQNMEQAKIIVKKALRAVDAEIREEREGYFKARRLMLGGIVVAGGGETLTVNMNKIQNNETFITVTTKTQFVGAAGMKAWSCSIVDIIIKLSIK